MKLASLNRFALLLSVMCAVATPTFASNDDLIITPVEKPAAAEASETPKAEAGTVVVGDMVVSHMKATTSKGHIDVFFTIKNNGKSDERITGAGSTWDIGEVVTTTKGKDGKETEGPVAIEVPAGKSVELSDSTQWLRITAVHTKPQDLSILPLNLYFRHSPNTPLQIPFGKSGK